MANSTNPFKDLNIDRAKMEQIVAATGASNYKYEKVGNSFHMSFVLDGKPHRLTVYENKNGTTTLSKQGMDDAVFEKIATALKQGCSVGDGGPFEFSVLRFDKEKIADLFEFLREQGVTLERDNEENGYRLVKLKSPQGDTLTVKHYGNGTLQMQGRRAMLATFVLDYLANVLSYEQAVKAQLDTYEVKLNVPEIRNEVEGKLPASFNRLSDVVQKQLTTALALSKLDIDLPDFTPVAFPAVRGLEGFIKTELKNAGLNPAPGAGFAEYFEQVTGGTGHKMREMQSNFVGELVATELARCYTLYSDERHGLAHLGLNERSSRLLPDLLTARTIIGMVFNAIEETCIKLSK